METAARRPGRPRRFACPPSGEKVLCALDKADAPLGPDQLQEAAGVPRRTMYFALDCLLRIGLVRVGIPLEDTRQRRYRLDPAHTMGRWQPCFKQGKCG